ncbi:MAG: SurA N-terminal domain-containing protein [Patescibacteria group bacterium]
MADRKASGKRAKGIRIPQEENLGSLSVIGSAKPKGLTKSKLLIPFIIIFLGAVLFFAKGLFIAALVNGQPISRIAIIQELEKRNGKNALSALVNETLIFQEASKKNIEISQKAIEDSAKQIEENFKKQGQNLDAALLAQGLTRKDFENQLKLRKIVEKLLAKDIKVSDKEVSDYIEKNKATLPEGMKEDEIKKGVRQQLEQQKFSIKSQELVTKLEKNAKINYFVNY